MGSDTLQCCYRDHIKYTLYSKFRVPKMYQLASMGRWDEIPARCARHPKEASFVHKYPPSDTALHRIVRPVPGEESLRHETDPIILQSLDQVRLDAVDALLRASDGKIASNQDSFGRTPLHLACMDLCIESPALSILQSNSYVASIRDSERRTALHVLCARNDIIPTYLLVALINAYPESIFLEDVTGDRPCDIVDLRFQDIKNAQEVKSILASFEHAILSSADR